MRALLLAALLAAPSSAAETRAAPGAVFSPPLPALPPAPAPGLPGGAPEALFEAGRRLEGSLTGEAQPRSVTVLYAPYGAGHEMAAKAVARAYLDRGAKVRLVDVTTYLPPWQHKLISKGHLFLMGRAPRVMGALYTASDFLLRLPGILQLRRWLDALTFRRLADDLVAEQPDVLVSTYLPSYAVEKARQEGRLRSTFGVAITDWRLHALWTDATPDRFYVAGKSLVPELVRRGVPEGRIVASGIPIDPGIAAIPPAPPRGKPSALVMMGGYGIGALDKIARSFAGTGLRLELVAGRNPAVQARLEALVRGLGLDATVRGFVPHEELMSLMARATMVVTKAGGVTVTEAQALSKPLVLIKPAVAQERDNARRAVTAGAAVMASAREAGRAAAALAAQPLVLRAMSGRSRALANPLSAAALADDLVPFN